MDAKERLVGPLRFLRLGFLLVAALFVGMFVLQARKNPIRGDEVEFFRCIENQRDNGRVLAYAGEIHFERSTLVPLGRDRLGAKELELFEFPPSAHVLKGNRFAIAGMSRYAYCLWHPPLYVALAALGAHALPLEPARDWLIRFANLPLMLLFGTACFWCASELYPERRTATTLATLALLTLNALWLEGASLLDYAGTVAPAAALVALASFRRIQRGFSWLALVGLALPWFATFGVSVAMLAAGFLAALATRDARQVGRLAAHAAGGFALFSAVFWAWAKLGHFPFDEPYTYNFLFRGGNSHGIKLWRSTVIFFRYAVESGVALSLLFAVLAALRLRRPGALAEPPTLLVASVLVAFGMHAFLRVDSYGFSKYILYALPIMALFVTGELWPLLAPAARFRRWAIVALGAVALEGATREAIAVALPLPNLYLAGQAGFRETAELVRDHTAPGDVILAHKDLAFAAERRFLPFSAPLTTDAALLERELTRHHIRVFTSTAAGLDVATPEVLELLARRFPRVLPAPRAFRIYAAAE